MCNTVKYGADAKRVILQLRLSLYDKAIIWRLSENVRE
jgi:hypothetical protein